MVGTPISIQVDSWFLPIFDSSSIFSLLVVIVYKFKFIWLYLRYNLVYLLVLDY